MLRRMVPAVCAGLALAVAATLPAAAATSTNTNAVSFQKLAQFGVPGSLSFDGSTFGGLSGINYDSATGTWRAISDDSSDHGPARFDYLSLGSTANGLNTALAQDTASPATVAAGVVPLQRADGTYYPPSATAGQDTVHPEGIAYDPTTGNVFWADEGANNTLLAIDPTVREAGTDGSYVATLPVSGALHSTGTSGIRDGEGLSGVAFSSNGQVAVSTVAGPLLQDGPNPTATTGGYARIVLQNRLLGFRPLAQYAYPLDALPLTDANGNGTNEIADILPVDTTHYLVLEHGTAAGKGNSVRLYEIDTTNATNVTTLTSLAGATFTPVSKTLLVDFATLHLGNVANFSGLTWGPTLPNGEKTLVLVSDNNFDSHTSTQFLALAVSGL